MGGRFEAWHRTSGCREWFGNHSTELFVLISMTDLFILYLCVSIFVVDVLRTMIYKIMSSVVLHLGIFCYVFVFAMYFSLNGS